MLYVDDDETIVLLVERLLARAGYRVSSHCDGRAAVAAVRSNPQDVDLVVSDYNMPGFNGIDVALAVAAIRPGLPVLISSGYISAELQQQADAAGVLRVMPKQNTLEELPALVAQVLGAQRLAADGQGAQTSAQTIVQAAG